MESAPAGLTRVFYADSGSVAVECAAKMALQYQLAAGRGSRRLLGTVRGGYHGDTAGAMALSDPDGMHHMFSGILSKHHFAPQPATPFGADWNPDDFAPMEAMLDRYENEIAAVILEPVFQGAGAMRFYHPRYLAELRRACSERDILLIFDEVATGFGRTGNRFVADLVLPDILVLGKALTGGYIGHAVTVANEKVFRGFYSDNERHALMHGPTFMGNALACAVALKGIEIFERENYMEKIKKIEEISKREMLGFSDERIKEVRVMGGCTCVEVYDPKTLEGFQQYAYERGVFSRPFLSYMYSMVPYVIEEDELVQIFTVMKDWFRRG